MARIPLGNFGSAAQAPETAVGAAQYRPSNQLGDAIEGLAQTVQQGAVQLGTEELHQQHAMARAKASDAMLDYELAAQDATTKLQTDVQSGAVPYDQAHQAYSDAIGKLNPPTVTGVTPEVQLAIDGGVKRANQRGQVVIQSTVKQAQQADFRGRFDSVLDKLGKLSGAQGADVDQINARAEAYRPLALQAGLNTAQVDKQLQDFKDKNWTNQATQASMVARNDPAALDQLASSLSDSGGFYEGKLDTDKRNAILGTVLARKQLLIDRQDKLQDRRDAAGVRAVAQIDQQIASGVPATANQWAQWSDSVKGTASQDDFRDRVTDEQEVQSILRKPPDQQAAYLQQKKADLANNGGSVREQQNVSRLTSAVAANVKQLQETPLLYNQSRMDDPVTPIDGTSFMGGQQDVADELQRRAQVIGSMQKTYGADLVKNNLLLPQEVTDLQGILTKSTPGDQLKLLGNLRRISADDGVYNAVMKQLSPKDNVLAFAGSLIGRDASVVTTSHWFKPDEKVQSDDAARTMLEGNRLLTTGGKKDDGEKFPLPPEGKFQAAFAEAFSDLFKGRPDALQNAMSITRSYYTGKAAQDGFIQTDDVDSNRINEAVKATLGNVADTNGNGQVITPWGMPEDTFDQSAERAFGKAVDKAKLPESLKGQFSTFGLQNARGDLYYVTKGRDYLHDAAGNPVMLNINDGIVADNKAAPAGAAQ
jgi:hypothetical protein